MFTAAELAEHQADAESLMTLTLQAYQPNGKTLNAAGKQVLGFTQKDLVCGKVQSGSAQGRDTVTRYIRIGEVERPVLAGGLHLPIGAQLPKPGKQRGLGWEYEVVAVGCADDPALLGRRYLVVEVPVKARATARRLDVIELQVEEG